MASSLTLKEVLARLGHTYTPPTTFLHWNSPLQLLIATVLSAQCTDARVNRVTPGLFARWKTAKDFAEAPLSALEDAIHSCGTYHVKARYLRDIGRMIHEMHQNEVPASMEALTALPGVGRKTAAIILYACFGKNEGVPVDTHVMRVSRRLGLTRHTAQKKIEMDLMAGAPRAQWGRVTTLLISHGRAVCTAYNRACDACLFRTRCPSSLTRGLPDLAGAGGTRKNT